MKTSVSSTAQSLSTRPGMLSGPGAFRHDPAEGSPHAVRGQRHHLSPGGGGVFCAVVLFCAQSEQEGIQLVQQGDGDVTGLWWGL